MNSHMNKNRKILLVIIVAVIAIAIVAAIWASYSFTFPVSDFGERRFPPSDYIFGDLELFYVAQTVLSSVNVALLIFLLTLYVDIYKKTRSQFTLGLIIFSMAFLFRTLTANPMFMWVFGFKAFGLGPFALLPDVFELLALSVLLYLSAKY